MRFWCPGCAPFVILERWLLGRTPETPVAWSYQAESSISLALRSHSYDSHWPSWKLPHRPRMSELPKWPLFLFRELFAFPTCASNLVEVKMAVIVCTALKWEFKTVRLGGRAWVWHFIHLLSLKSCSGSPASVEKAPHTKPLLLSEQGYGLPTQGESKRKL